MARPPTGGGTGAGAPTLRLLVVALAVNIPVLAVVMLVTGDTALKRALGLSLVGLLVGVAGVLGVRWTSRRDSGGPR